MEMKAIAVPKPDLFAESQAKLNNIEGRLQKLISQLDEKLGYFIYPAAPVPADSGKIGVNLPDYFSDLDNIADALTCRLDGLEDIISRIPR